MELVSIKTIYLLGITNIIFGILVLFSCRCFVGFKWFIALMQKPLFRRFYEWHCWWWRLFIASVFLHTLVAFLIFGFPF